VPPLPSFISTSSSNRRRVKASCARRALHPRPEGRSFPRNKDKSCATAADLRAQARVSSLIPATTNDASAVPTEQATGTTFGSPARDCVYRSPNSTQSLLMTLLVATNQAYFMGFFFFPGGLLYAAFPGAQRVCSFSRRSHPALGRSPWWHSSSCLAHLQPSHAAPMRDQVCEPKKVRLRRNSSLRRRLFDNKVIMMTGTSSRHWRSVARGHWRSLHLTRVAASSPFHNSLVSPGSKGGLVLLAARTMLTIGVSPMSRTWSVTAVTRQCGKRAFIFRFVQNEKSAV
jgi:hypothetical protein